MDCPRCRSSRVYPSRLRSMLERVRQRFTERQPYRCHACNWRGWHDVEFKTKTPDVTPEVLHNRGLIKKAKHDIVVLGSGEVSKSLKVSAHRFTKSAREKIEKAGGSATVLE